MADSDDLDGGMEEDEQRRRRDRSPNYPSVGLSTAIGLVRKVYGNEKRGAMPAKVAAAHLGYKSLSGPARVALSALKKYGLLVEQGDDLKVSNDAISILVYPEGAPERDEAIRRLALKPDIFQQIFNRYPDSSNHTLKAKLISDWKFTDTAADAFIKAFRETLQLAKLDGTGVPDPEPEQAANSTTLREREAPAPHIPTARLARTPPPSGGRVYVFPLAGVDVEIRASGPLSADHLDQLSQYLALAKRVLESDEKKPD